MWKKSKYCQCDNKSLAKSWLGWGPRGLLHSTPGSWTWWQGERWRRLLWKRWVLTLVFRLSLVYFLTSTFKQEERAVKDLNLLQVQDHDQPHPLWKVQFNSGHSRQPSNQCLNFIQGKHLLPDELVSDSQLRFGRGKICWWMAAVTSTSLAWSSTAVMAARPVDAVVPRSTVSPAACRPTSNYSWSASLDVQPWHSRTSSWHLKLSLNCVWLNAEHNPRACSVDPIGSHSKDCYGESPPKLFLAWCCGRRLGPLGGCATEELAAWSLSLVFDRRLDHDHFLSCALWPLGSRPWADQMDLLREAVGRGVGRGIGSLGASALWLLRDLWALVCVLPRPFSVKLFIGLLWSGGKILFPVGKCFAMIVEYIQGDC